MKHMIRIVALLMAALMMVTSCQAPDSGSQLTDGTVDVSFAGPSARTITTDDGLVQTVATSDLWFQYKAEWQGSGEVPTTAKNEWTRLSGRGLTGTIKLHRGTWNLSLRAFVNETAVGEDDKFILSGTLPRVEIGANNLVTQTVSINLGYVRQEGNGTLHVIATYPVVYREGANPESPMEAVRKVKVTANVSGTDYTGDITAFDSNNVGSLDLTVPAGAAHVTVQYYMDDSSLFEDDKASKDVLIMATMTTNLAVSVDRDITSVTFTAEQPTGTVEDNVIARAESLFDIYPGPIADNEIVIGYAEQTKALGDQTPITYPYTAYATASRDEKGRYKASELGLVPITVTTDADLRTSGATAAWWGKTAVGGDANMQEPNTTLASVKFVDGVTEIKDFAFAGFGALTSIEIPVSVTSIGNVAFGACQGLASVTIPVGVTSIGEGAFVSCTSLTNVSIPEGVSRIGSLAFAGCIGLSNISIPNSVTSIGQLAFYSCQGLASVTIPVSVTSIGESAFAGCSLTSLNYPGNRAQWNLVSYTDDIDVVCLDGNAVYKTAKNTDGEDLYVAGLTPYGRNNCTELSIPDCVTSIGDRAFYGCSSMTNITIPSSVTSIGEYAFAYCTSLASITIPEGVTSIGSGTFMNCTALTSVTIPESVTFIDQNIFSYCTALTSVTIPEGVTTIGYQAFRGCTGLTSVMIPESVTSIGNQAFKGCTGLASITIPENVTSIGEGAFGECEGLTSITIPDNVTEIRYQAFQGCTGLTRVTISSSVTSIGEKVFNGCTALTSVTIPDNVTSIGNRAFFDCANLTSVTIPESVTSIGKETFFNCYSLTDITYTGTVEHWHTLGYDGFYNVDIICSDGKAIFTTRKTTLNDGTVDLSICGLTPYGKNNCTEITIPEGFTKIVNSAFRGYTGLTGVTIPDSVTSIEDRAFEDCTNLTSVTLPDSITSIRDSVFYGCTNLTNITIPDSVTSIGRRAFYECTSLTSITIPDGVTEIKTLAFKGCEGLTNITIPNSLTTIDEDVFRECSSVTSITIPESITSIGESAFYGCSALTSVTIPTSVTEIGDGAFAGCRRLSIFYDGTLGQWDAIGYAGPSTADVICTDGKVVFRIEKGTKYDGTKYTSLYGLTPYGKASFTEIIIPEGISSINQGAFAYCYSLTSITIPDSVTEIGIYSFQDCSGLTSITIPSSVTEIEMYTFYHCTSLTSVTIPDSITSVGERAFCGCTGLTSITLPGRVTEIGDSVFENCTGLTDIYINQSQNDTLFANAAVPDGCEIHWNSTGSESV